MSTPETPTAADVLGRCGWNPAEVREAEEALIQLAAAGLTLVRLPAGTDLGPTVIVEAMSCLWHIRDCDCEPLYRLRSEP